MVAAISSLCEFMDAHQFWKKRPFAVGDAIRYVLGPLTVYVLRHDNEWQIFYAYDDHPLTNAEAVERLTLSVDEVDEFANTLKQVRVSDSTVSTTEELRLRFIPADRPILARPANPVHILENSVAHWYVTTPAWVQIIRDPGATVLYTLPTWRPSDSWFGPPTGPGPLCYASKTRAYHVLNDLPHHSLRMVTHTILQNNGPSLEVERIVVPTPHLQVWINETGRLWTQSVSIKRGADGQLTDARVLTAPPKIAGTCEHVSRGHLQDAGRGSLRGLMDSLFG